MLVCTSQQQIYFAVTALSDAFIASLVISPSSLRQKQIP